MYLQIDMKLSVLSIQKNPNLLWLGDSYFPYLLSIHFWNPCYFSNRRTVWVLFEFLQTIQHNAMLYFTTNMMRLCAGRDVEADCPSSTSTPGPSPHQPPPARRRSTVASQHSGLRRAIAAGLTVQCTTLAFSITIIP